MGADPVGSVYDPSLYKKELPVWVPIKAQKTSFFRAKQPESIERWVKGQVLEVLSKNDTECQLIVITEQDGQLTLSSNECPLQNERDDTVDDLVGCDFLHEPGILHTLQVRYTLDMIYTYSGNILIAANPFKRIKNMYGPRMMIQYRDQQLGKLSPHAYAIAEQAFSSMMIDENKQAILISGESGAGKTETAKMVMQYLAQRASSANMFMTNTQLTKTFSKIPIEEQVLESNPLLEAFGNAKTSRNENSSRFGKFVEIYFDNVGKVLGAQIRTYLLERSRVVKISSPERSYHIFYQLIRGATPEQVARFHLEAGLEGFRVITQSEMRSLSKVTDEEEFGLTVGAMGKVGISGEEQDAILSVVAAVMHLCNIEWEGRDEAEPKGEGSEKALGYTAELLGVGVEELRVALSSKTVLMAGDKIQKPLGAAEAAANQQALAKTIYARLFDWIVTAINKSIAVTGAARHSHRVIGILDIYGFEHFKVNSFEQLCINLANERLQQQFNGHVFKGEQQIYQDEGITWSYIDFVDNQDCIDLLEGSKSIPGIFPAIDEACKIAGTTADALARDLAGKCAESARYASLRKPLNSFSVAHYAGDVVYSTDLLIDKNKDYVVESHQALMQKSALGLVRTMFPPPPKEDSATAPAADAAGSASAAGPKRRVRQAAIKFNSVGASFKVQLGGLMDTLNSCSPHYIRCIKPNADSAPGTLDPSYSLEQLRAGGVLEAVRIACAGFPTRKHMIPFAVRYSMLLDKTELTDWNPYTAEEDENWDGARTVCGLVLKQEQLNSAQLGKKRVFLRSGQLAQLESSRTIRMAARATQIQSVYRMYTCKKQYKRARHLITRLQARVRGKQQVARYQVLRKHAAATKIQAAYKGYAAKKAYQLQRQNRAATVIQAMVRMRQQRAKFIKETELGKKMAEKAKRDWAVGLMQKYARNWLLAQRQKREAARQKLLNDLNGTIAQLQLEVQFWQSKCEDSDALVEELRANVKTLTNDMEVVKAQAGRVAQDEIDSAVRRAHQSAMNEIKIIKQQKDEAEAKLTEYKAEVEAESVARGQKLESNEAEVTNMRGQLDEVKGHLVRVQQEGIEKEGVWKGEVEGLKSELEGVRGELKKGRVQWATMQKSYMQQLESQKKARSLEPDVAAQIEQGKQALQQVTALQSDLQATVNDNAALAARLEDRERHVRLLEAKLTEANATLADVSKEQLLGAGLERGVPAGVGVLPTGTLSALKTGVSDVSTVVGGGLGARRLSEGEGQDHMQVVDVMLKAVTSQKLSKLALPTSRLPMASWIISRSIFEWCRSWDEHDMQETLRLTQTSLESTMAKDASLVGRIYWFHAMLGTSGLLKTYASTLNSHVLSDMSKQLLRFTAIHELLQELLLENLRLDPGELLSAKWGKLLRNRGGNRADKQDLVDGLNNKSAPWETLKGSLTNIIAQLKREGVPAPAVRAISLSLLAYIDAQVLNSLMLIRDCCSTSAVKALQKGIQELRKWATSQGLTWCGSIEQVDYQLRHLNQAVRYMLQGKDEVCRQMKHADIKPLLKKYTKHLNITQIYRLTEHYYDDWNVSQSAGQDSYALLEHIHYLQTQDPHSHQPLSRSSSQVRLSKHGGGAGSPPGGGPPPPPPRAPLWTRGGWMKTRCCWMLNICSVLIRCSWRRPRSCFSRGIRSRQ